jgi:hypothetical protein
MNNSQHLHWIRLRPVSFYHILVSAVSTFHCYHAFYALEQIQYKQAEGNVYQCYILQSG